MCRKNIASLTPAERRAYVDAVRALKDSGGYDTYVDQHFGAGPHGHSGPAFFPWHREYIRRFELALQDIDSSINLPYWDWTVDNLNTEGTESLIWRDDFMGGAGDPANGFQVTTGPFADWGIRRNAFDIFSSPGGGGTINTFLNRSSYTGFRSTEGPHGGAHMWVGGDMGSVPIAPRDPVFFLLHGNVDWLWSEWINRHEGEPGFEPFEPVTGAVRQGHNLNDSMWPWNGTTDPFGVPPWTMAPEIRRPADQVDHRAVGYFYDTIDPECQPTITGARLPKATLKDRLPRELVERMPKEFKERLPKERMPKEFKERLPKEFAPKERLPKEIKERLPKEFAPKERSPKEGKDIREIEPRRPFIRGDLRPELALNSLAFESDISERDMEVLRRSLISRDRLLDDF